MYAFDKEWKLKKQFTFRTSTKKFNENKEKELRREEYLKRKQGNRDTSAGLTEEKLNECCNCRITKL